MLIFLRKLKKNSCNNERTLILSHPLFQWFGVPVDHCNPWFFVAQIKNKKSLINFYLQISWQYTLSYILILPKTRWSTKTDEILLDICLHLIRRFTWNFVFRLHKLWINNFNWNDFSKKIIFWRIRKGWFFSKASHFIALFHKLFTIYLNYGP